MPIINEHLANLHTRKEITEPATIRIFRIVQKEGSREATIRNFRIVRLEGTREVARAVEHYNLDAIIAVGFRVNSVRAIQF